MKKKKSLIKIVQKEMAGFEVHRNLERSYTTNAYNTYNTIAH